ncbi:MAG: hypothetical protein FJ255_10205 [Phycisphaerae bacterium]|nr:hypothetical protein [Phycisphaerae bacterium]
MIVHLNGDMVPVDQARVSPLDRGFLFGDGLYEGLRAFGGHVVAMDLHEKRLREGLAECRIPYDAGRMAGIADAVLRANSRRDAFVYFQVTRGVPEAGQPVRARLLTGAVRPTVFAFCTPTPPASAYDAPPVKSCVTLRDTRWLRGRVKSVSLIGGVLACIEADEAGHDDAILVRDTPAGPLVAESTSANALVALRTPRGVEIATPDLGSVPILAGVTRDLLLRAAPEIVERPIALSELERADEVMLCGTLTMVTSITRLNGRPVGDGTPGPIARRLLRTLLDVIARGG